MTIDFRALAQPFAPNDIEWRVGQRSKDGTKASLLCYLTSRAVQVRLDEVVGPASWRDSYLPITEGPKTIGFMCTLELEVAPGVWVGKTDVADTTDIEPLKGGISGALKRAAVKWGIGRYLYGVDSRYHPIRDGYGPDNAVYCPIGDKKAPGHIVPPQLPDWAMPPKGTKTTPKPPPPQLVPDAEARTTETTDPTPATPAGSGKHHDASWKDDAPGFCAFLRDTLHLKYEEVADMMSAREDARIREAERRPATDDERAKARPSAMTQPRRNGFRRWLNSQEGRAALAAYRAQSAA